MAITPEAIKEKPTIGTTNMISKLIDIVNLLENKFFTTSFYQVILYNNIKLFSNRILINRTKPMLYYF